MTHLLSYRCSLSLNDQIPLALPRKTIRSLRSMNSRTCTWGTSEGRRSCEACPQESGLLSRTPCPEASFLETNTAKFHTSLSKGGLQEGFEPELNPYFVTRGGPADQSWRMSARRTKWSVFARPSPKGTLNLKSGTWNFSLPAFELDSNRSRPAVSLRFFLAERASGEHRPLRRYELSKDT